jgi:hypothetical protein
VEDWHLGHVIAGLSGWIDLHHLEIPPKAFNAVGCSAATEELVRIHLHSCPHDKLMAITAAFRLMAMSVPGCEPQGADVMLPIFILVLIRTGGRMRHPRSDLE